MTRLSFSTKLEIWGVISGVRIGEVSAVPHAEKPIEYTLLSTHAVEMFEDRVGYLVHPRVIWSVAQQRSGHDDLNFHDAMS